MTLGRYLGQWPCGLIACGFKQLELLFGSDVGHMEARTKLARQVDGERRALVTSLLRAYERVQHDGWVVAIGLFHALHVLVDERRILTMRHHGQAQGGTGLEHLDERPELIHQHASRGGAHKQLDAWQPGLVEFGVIGHIIARGAIVESVVDVAFLVPAPHLVVPRPLRGGLRNGVGHIEERRHTAIGGRPRLTLDVGLVGQSGLTEVHMTVDHAGQHKTPRGIQSVVEDARGISFPLTTSTMRSSSMITEPSNISPSLTIWPPPMIVLIAIWVCASLSALLARGASKPRALLARLE